MPENRKTSPFAKAMRQAGFVPLPRLWIKRVDMPAVHKIAHPHLPEILGIRAKLSQGDSTESVAKDQAELEKEAAWAAFEKMRSQG